MEIFLILAVELKKIKGFDFEIVDLKMGKIFPERDRKIPGEKKIAGSIWMKPIVFSKTIK